MPSSAPSGQSGQSRQSRQIGPRWSLRRRLVVLIAVVSLASSLLTALVLARVLVLSNREQATAALTLEADTLAALVGDGRDLRAERRERVLDARSGWAAAIVAADRGPVVPPFTPQDVAGAAADAEAVERDVDGTRWLIAARPAGDRTVLVARRLAAAVRLSADQRRRALLGGLLGLAGGGLAGLVLARSVTAPLGRLAAVARRLSAGEREIAVAAEGPAEVADLAEGLDALARALSASEQRQRRFLLAVSHELRTPLTAVTGYAEALADQALPAAEVPHAAGVIAAEAARLQRRVEDLLALARLEADDFALVAAPVDVGALIRAAAAAFTPRAIAAQVRLDVHAAPSGPIVVTDGERLRQMVDALADNALRVLGPGDPLVLSCRERPDGGVRVEVRDGGPGLAPEELAVAFQRGELTERYRGRRAVGSGVGLALVGELARRLGGTAQALPAPEGGVCFAVDLPAAAAARTLP